MDYYQLDTETAKDYVRSLPEMQTIFSDLDGLDNLDVQEVGDGNLNFVFIISNRKNPEETVVLKQAVPFLRVVGESWPLSRERMNSEVNALRFQHDLCPDLVPAIFHSSEDMSVVIMQNLNKHKILRGEIILGKKFPKLAEDVSTFLAKTLFFSSDFFQTPDIKKPDVAKTINTELCKITEDFVFTHPYEDNDTNDYNPELSDTAKALIQQDSAVRAAVGEMKYAFMTQAESLLHGDLHIGSIMANENDTYVIDPEFGFYGPMGFDIGAMIGNLFLSYFSHDYRQREMGNDPTEYRAWLLENIEAIWQQFESKFLDLWREHDAQTDAPFLGADLNGESAEAYRQLFMQKLFAETIGFAACKMMRRIVGLAKVADIADIPDLKERAKAEENVLKMGSYMVVNRREFKTIQALTDLAKSTSPLSGTE